MLTLLHSLLIHPPSLYIITLGRRRSSQRAALPGVPRGLLNHCCWEPDRGSARHDGFTGKEQASGGGGGVLHLTPVHGPPSATPRIGREVGRAMPDC